MSKNLIKGIDSKPIVKKKEPFVMYSRDGRTYDIDKCGMVCIFDYEGVEAFVEASSDVGCVCDGIGLPGIYIWNDESFSYTRISESSESYQKEYLFNIGQSLINFSKTL